MKPSLLAAVALAVCVGVVNIRGAAGLSTAFTYQGQLLQSGGPVNGSCDLQFELFDAASGGNQVGTTQTASGVSIANGLFTVSLDFGSQFSGAGRWLQIALRCPASVGSFSAPLTPREQLTATPYALFAPTAGSAEGLSCSGCVTGSAIASSTIPASSLAFTPGTVTSITVGAGLTGGTITTSGTISIGVVPVANGGTGASDAADARDNLEAAASGVNWDIVSLEGASDDNDNTALGVEALDSNTTGNDNTAAGAGTLFANTTGYENTAAGWGALQANSTGYDNTAAGADALYSNTSGYENTAVGGYALNANTGNDTCTSSGTPLSCCRGAGTGFCGSNNTATGADALEANTTGYNNTAAGSAALEANTTGYGNTAAGENALRSNTTGYWNTAAGFGALYYNTGNDTCAGLGTPLSCCTGAGAGLCGSDNTAVGVFALRSNTTGFDNTAAGFGALANSTTGYNNTAAGEAALAANTTGFDNTAAGQAALHSNTTGYWNTAAGQGALSANTGNDTCTSSGTPLSCCTGAGAGFCGTGNTAAGSGALQANSTGYDNTAAGAGALFSNTIGIYNTATGQGALFANTFGSGNTAAGEGALANTTGNDNIGLGWAAGSNLTTLSNNIEIGNSGTAADSNTIRIGNASHTATFIAGIGVGVGGSQVCFNGGQLGLCSSSARFKEQIRDIADASNQIFQLRPVRFRYKKDFDPSGQERFGLVAEEVAKVNPDLVVYDRDGKPLTVRYDSVNAMLLNEVQQQARQIAAQQRQLATLKNEVEQLAALKEETLALQARLQALEGQGGGDATQRGVSGKGVTAAAF